MPTKRLGYYDDFKPDVVKERRRRAADAASRPTATDLKDMGRALKTLSQDNKPSLLFDEVMAIVLAAPAWRLKV